MLVYIIGVGVSYDPANMLTKSTSDRKKKNDYALALARRTPHLSESFPPKRESQPQSSGGTRAGRAERFCAKGERWGV